MSAQLMPLAPKAAWRSLPFGEAARIPVVTQGAAKSVAADWRMKWRRDCMEDGVGAENTLRRPLLIRFLRHE
jgi:hypothetical protein